MTGIHARGSRLLLRLLPGLLAVAPLTAQDLDPRLVGDYRTADGRLVVIARTATRPIFFEPSSGRIRVLFPAEGEEAFRAGPGLLDRDSVAFRVRFVQGSGTVPDRIVIRAPAGSYRVAARIRPYRAEEVHFRQGAIELAGTLRLPSPPGPHPGLVVVHGSGAQDRHGSLAIQDLVADHFARHGFAVLTWDKRGVGVSTGDWRSAGFDELAADARAAIGFLADRPEVCRGSIGLWGISQAGWVAARLAAGPEPRPAFAVLVSAAGAGVTAAEQNRWNVEAELRGAGFGDDRIRRALEAWRRAHRAVDRGQGGWIRDVDPLVAELREAGLPSGLLPPRSGEFEWNQGTEWFQALDADYDPLPDWRAYPGPLLAIFGGNDASTPTDAVVRRLGSLERDGITIEVFPDANHVLLESVRGTVDELPGLDRFVPGAFHTMTAWAGRHAGC